MRTRTRIVYKSVPVQANIPNHPEFEGEFVFVRTVVGTIEMNLGFDQEWFPIFSGMKLRTKVGESFEKVALRSTAGGTANFYYGWGDVANNSEASAAGATQLTVGAIDDPNGTYTPADLNSPAFYYKDQAVPPVIWIWSVLNQNWFVAMS